jgi:hypothetical protein
MTRARLPLTALALLLAACPGRLRFGPEGEITDPVYLLRRLDARASKVRSLKGEASVKVKAGSGSGSVGEFVAALRPASLHLETLNFFGKPVAALATDGKAFALFVEEGATFYRGPPTAANVGRLLPVAVAPAEVVSILLGDVPRLAEAAAHLEVDRDALAYRLTLERGETRQTIWLGTEDLRLLKSETRGESGYDIVFDDYQVVDDVLFPMQMEIRTVLGDGTPAGAELFLHFKDAQLNVALDSALFALEPPPGARRVELDAQGHEIAASAP